MAAARTKEEAQLLLDPGKTKQNKDFLFLFCLFRDFGYNLKTECNCKDSLCTILLYNTVVGGAGF